MMDYFGSIVKSESEIDSELIERFRDRCHESFMKKIIQDLKKEQVLLKEYSVSGWMVFHGKTIHDIIKNKINVQTDKNKQKLKFTYCFNKLFNDTNVCQMICDKI
tara:strand:- start:312 stop:626 length:315 start_codon:yes stop_codon:yes gene_type:complete